MGRVLKKKTKMKQKRTTMMKLAAIRIIENKITRMKNKSSQLRYNFEPLSKKFVYQDGLAAFC